MKHGRRGGIVKHGRDTLLMLALSLALSVAAPLMAAQAATIVGLWHMNETSGSTANDSSGHHNDGKLQNIQFTSGAYQFNGHNSRVLVPDSSSLDPGNSDITISLQVKFTARPSRSVGDYDLLRKGDGNSFYKIEISEQGKARCQFHGSSGDAGLVFGPDLSNGQWHTITCSKTGTRISGTVDGKGSSRGAHVGSISNNSPLSFGGKASGSQDLYQGLMSEVKITVG
jgi:Concanavalin A-like lectin/glucanases superfamily